MTIVQLLIRLQQLLSPTPVQEPTNTPAQTDHGAVVAVEYGLTLGLGTVLLVIALSSVSGVIDDEQQRITEEQIQLLAERAAGDIQAVEESVSSQTTPQRSTYREVNAYPDRIVETRYEIHFNQTAVRVETTDGATATAIHNATVPINSTTVTGQDLRLTWNGVAIQVTPATLPREQVPRAETTYIPSIANTNTPVDDGNTVEITAQIANTGNESAPQMITLRVDGVERKTRVVNVTPGTTTTETFEYETAVGGPAEQTVAVSTHDATDTTTVEFDQLAGPFTIDSFSAESSYEAGSEAEFTVQIQNEGVGVETTRVEIRADGQAILSRSVTLASLERRELEIEGKLPQDLSGGVTLTAATEDDTESEATAFTPGDQTNFGIDSVRVPDTIRTDETLTAEFTIENGGDIAGTREMNLSIDGQEVDSLTRELESGGELSGSFTWEPTPDDVGTREVTVATPSDSREQSVTVEEPDEGEFIVEITDYTEEVAEGETAAFAVEVTNVGDQTATQLVTLDAGADTVAAQDLTVRPGEASATILQWETTDENGGRDYLVTVRTDDDTAVRETTVRESGTNSIDPSAPVEHTKSRDRGATPTRQTSQPLTREAVSQFDRDSSKFPTLPVSSATTVWTNTHRADGSLSVALGGTSQ